MARSLVTDGVDRHDEPRAAALDFGMARIGVAVADELGLLAHPRPFIAARPPARALRDIARLGREEGIGLFLVGLPLNLNGTESRSSERVRKFAAEVEKSTGIAVTLVDERLSTVEAQGRLSEAGRSAKDSRAHIDSASAAVLLQSYLDARRTREA